MLVVTTVSYYDMAGRNVMGLLLVKRLLPISPADRRKVGEFVFRQPIVPAPGNVYVERMRTPEIQTGWSPRSERPFQH